MNNEEILKDPIEYYGPGKCCKCLTNLKVVDIEMTIIDVDNNGNPISDDVTVQCKGVCPRCGYEVPMIRWQGGYIPYSPLVILMKKDEIKQRIKERKDAIPINENPLAI